MTRAPQYDGGVGGRTQADAAYRDPYRGPK